MGWNIRIWHEEDNGNTRLCLETNADVPDDVISSLAGSYWLEEVQYAEIEWDEGDGIYPESSSPKLQG